MFQELEEVKLLEVVKLTISYESIDNRRIKQIKDSVEYKKGSIHGTVHTCIGQEINALGVCQSIKRDDIVISNHRCHGHYISYTKDWKGLIRELLGKKDGVSKGIGSSQHLQKRNFSAIQ